jgi:two-component system LytT family response regulator
MIKGLLIDDEESTLKVLNGMIKKYIPEIEILYCAIGSKQGLQAIQDYKPDLVFLDVEMPMMNGFELLHQFPGHTFEVIFVTAYDYYAIKAVRFSALDYLLKPVDKDELLEAVHRFLDKKNSANNLKEQYENLLHNLKNNNKENYKLAISTSEGIQFIVPENIIRCEAIGAYTKFYLADRKTIVTSKVLKEYDEMLSEHNFIRVHRTHLVNKKFVNAVSTDHQLIMSDNTQIEISRRKWDDVKKVLAVLK